VESLLCDLVLFGKLFMTFSQFDVTLGQYFHYLVGPGLGSSEVCYQSAKFC